MCFFEERGAAGLFGAAQLSSFRLPGGESNPPATEAFKLFLLMPIDINNDGSLASSHQMPELSSSSS